MSRQKKIRNRNIRRQKVTGGYIEGIGFEREKESWEKQDRVGESHGSEKVHYGEEKYAEDEKERLVDSPNTNQMDNGANRSEKDKTLDIQEEQEQAEDKNEEELQGGDETE
ncbi:hypothetical protein HAX54_029675 [Datura stramonium]|uniref:Uncharacterized protein n=1 Tax=Datura stramonium TaxID=4076 RepID=A0ABS8V6D6_DATST|nr:hypothetical protein [Datura stramonium]